MTDLPRAWGWLSGHRLAVGLAAGVLASLSLVGIRTTAGAAGASALLALVWWRWRPASFDRCVAGPVSRCRRRSWCRREWRWATFEAGVAGAQDRELVLTSSRQITGVPRLRGVHCERMLDWLEFRPSTGQTIEQWHEARERLAKALGARTCNVVVDHDGMFLLSVVRDGHDWPTADTRSAETTGGVR